VTRFGVDVGGTFTDIVSFDDDGRIATAKVRSTRGTMSPGVWGAVDRLGTHAAEASLVHGSTVATNALLERSGGRVTLVTTAGFEDLLWLRRQDRADLYDLSLDHPPPLVERADVIGVRERVGADGPVRELADAEIERVVAEVRRRDPDAVAIALLFSFRDPTHERRLAEAIRDALPSVSVAASSEVLPVFREFERTSTTVAEAYLRPLVGGYLARMGREAGAHGIADLRIMASNGGTLSVAQAAERAAALALSGPAGGVEWARLVGAQLGEGDLLTLDMGGTSADASVVLDGRPLMQTAGDVGGVPLALPHILIETVGAGGGSVAWADRGGALRVGPRSAGAMPGPACYGLGGIEPTVTDAALVLGWLDAGQPLADDLVLDPGLARIAVGALAGSLRLPIERCAEGIIEVATATMVRALRRVSVERGLDPRQMTLVPFGGAGPMFTCRMAEQLGMRRAVVPPNAGVLSALGLASAPARVEFIASVHRPAGELPAEALDAAYAPMEDAARQSLPGARLERQADCRYPGQGYELAVPVIGDGPVLAATFHRAHLERFGHAAPERSVEVVNLRTVAVHAGRTPVLAARDGVRTSVAGRASVCDLKAGSVLTGPCMLDAPDCTVRVEAGWTGTLHETGALVVERS
jgi:N-methylhydantoinase A